MKLITLLKATSIESISIKNPPPSSPEATNINTEASKSSPKIIKRVPKSKKRYDTSETRFTFAILTPARTGSIWVSAPKIIKLKKPMVSACVIAIDSSENLLESTLASLKSIKIPARTPKRGAVKKNLRGAHIGGA